MLNQLIVALLTGLMAHWAYFVHGELDLQAPNIVGVHLLLAFLIPSLKFSLDDLQVTDVAKQSVAIELAYLAALFLSILIRRLFLSPLRQIPGPIYLRLTKLTHVWLMSRCHNFKLLDNLRRQYGEIVVTGPSEVTLFGYEAYHMVHGVESNCRRAAYYDVTRPMVSLISTRDARVHAQRHKVWAQAFSPRSMEQNEPVIHDQADKLVLKLMSVENQPVNVTKWIEHFTFDVMGLFGLEIDFKNLSDTEHPMLGLYSQGHNAQGPLASAPWIQHLIVNSPVIRLSKSYSQMMRWVHGALHDRIENERKTPTGRPSIIHYIVDDALRNGGIESNWNFIMGDFMLVIIAGSDTVRQVLVNLMYYFVRYPEHLRKVRDELDAVDLRDSKAVNRAQHLTACIYETLRLNPPVPSAGLRVSPPGGLWISETFIPEGTTLVTPQYSLMRDERSFSQPDMWIPERFTSQPELVFNKNAFVPWGIGKMSCIGKNWSLVKTRLAAARIATRLDFDFAPSEDGQRMFTEATDYMTTTPGPLHLVFRRRKDVQ